MVPIKVHQRFPTFYVCDNGSSKRYVTLDPTMETAVASDSYYKRMNTNAFSGTLHNIATY